MKRKVRKIYILRNGQISKKGFSSVTILIMISGIFISAWMPINVTGAELVITGEYIVSGTETWDNITVTGTGKLIVPTGATLNAINITMESGSIFEATGGNVILTNPNPREDVKLSGSCLYFNVTDLSSIELTGSDGYADTSSPGPYNAFIPTSRGGDATMNITATGGITITNSMINITGGHGFDLPASTDTNCNAWTQGTDLNSYIAAGGNATFYFNLLHLTTPIIIYDSTLNVTGGNGGKAADGGNSTGDPAAKGGGYTNGATVSSYVGSGGSSRLYIYSLSSILLNDSTLNGHAGNGGNAGDGGSSGGYGGSGGGGYCGGNGVSFDTASAGSGGITKENVGTGGRAEAQITSNNLLILYNDFIDILSGKGGDAGNGGGWNPAWEAVGGRGGGGYGGGGGGGYYGGARLGGYDGYVYDRVGSGGNLSMNLSADNIDIYGTTFNLRTGDGGKAGDPGWDCDLPGGGGYGGGGGGYYQADGGSGTVIGDIGVGGDMTVSISSAGCTFLDSEIFGKAGDGGDAASGGSVYLGSTSKSGSTGSGGGGGYGGGGGARSADGGDVFVSGSVGMGGEVLIDINVQNFFSKDSIIGCTGGNGGEAGDGGDTEDNGAGGGGGFGGGGAADANGRGGSYTVEGNIGRGGNSTITVSSNRFIAINTKINATGGNGGDGGLGGEQNSTFVQSAGGGGYGGGGGGCGGVYIGGYGDVTGYVGDGGNAAVGLFTIKATISADSEILANNGPGGNGTDSPGEGVNGGEGEGRITADGIVLLEIPMSVTLLLSPVNNSNVTATPNFEWLALHNSTTNGDLVNYVIEIDDNPDFLSLVNSAETPSANYIPSLPLPLGTFYWRVQANYSIPLGSSKGWSEIWVVTIGDDLIPPVIYVKEPGETPGQTYYIGDIITITWIAEDDYLWPNGGNVVNISYGTTQTGGTTIVIQTQEDGSYDWNTASIPAGTYYINITIYDAGENFAGDSSNYTFDLLLDTIEPSSNINALPSILTTSNFIVTATANDMESGLQKVELWYKKDTSWVLYSTDTTSPWSWTFDTSTTGGDGTYQFYSRAWDNENNYEDAPLINDTWTIVDTTKPRSSVDALSTYTATETFAITASASDTNGVSKVELWYKKDDDSWTKYGDDMASQWSWDFDTTTTGGDGKYQFYSRAYDVLNNYEAAPLINDTWTIVDATKPISSVDALSTYTANGIFIIIATASDTNDVLKVELWYKKEDRSWTKYGDDSTSPWSWDFDTSISGGDGIYQFYSRAWDNAGNYGDAPATNDTWTIVDTTKPIIDIESPINGSTITSSSVTVKWFGYDATSGIDHFEVRINGGDYVNVGLETSYTLEKINDGNHNIAVEAVDKAGNFNETTLNLKVDTTPFSPSGPFGGLFLWILIFVITACIILVLWLMKRKKEPEETLPQEQIQRYTPPQSQDLSQDATSLPPSEMQDQPPTPPPPES